MCQYVKFISISNFSTISYNIALSIANDILKKTKRTRGIIQPFTQYLIHTYRPIIYRMWTKKYVM